jgi:hypothetical protein
MIAGHVCNTTKLKTQSTLKPEKLPTVGCMHPFTHIMMLINCNPMTTLANRTRNTYTATSHSQTV